MISVQINDEGFERDMGLIIDRARFLRPVMAAVGREGQNRLKQHFRAKDRSDANKLAPDRRSHLWLRIANSVNSPEQPSDDRITINIADPTIAQKVFGGPITAKRVQNLAIPESDEAYNRAPSVFEHETGLKLIFVKANDHAFLAARIDPNSQFLQVEYLLTPSVDQEADPTALPDPDEFSRQLLDRGQRVVNRLLQKESPE
ncbi:MAG TPA: hypothetical protein VN281_22750 [Verrucomicrobiae bacterium]|jgi:hypothetical protein|nr:hypothetical protein [Verrucomicrobiae bacterium]